MIKSLAKNIKLRKAARRHGMTVAEYKVAARRAAERRAANTGTNDFISRGWIDKRVS